MICSKTLLVSYDGFDPNQADISTPDLMNPLAPVCTLMALVEIFGTFRRCGTRLLVLRCVCQLFCRDEQKSKQMRVTVVLAGQTQEKSSENFAPTHSWPLRLTRPLTLYQSVDAENTRGSLFTGVTRVLFSVIVQQRAQMLFCKAASHSQKVTEEEPFRSVLWDFCILDVGFEPYRTRQTHARGSSAL